MIAKHHEKPTKTPPYLSLMKPNLEAKNDSDEQLIYTYPATGWFRRKESCQFTIEDQRKILRTLLPGKPGIKKLVDLYGEKLISIRYRNDLKNKQRLKTRKPVINRQK